MFLYFCIFCVILWTTCNISAKFHKKYLFLLAFICRTFKPAFKLSVFHIAIGWLLKFVICSFWSPKLERKERWKVPRLKRISFRGWPLGLLALRYDMGLCVCSVIRGLGPCGSRMCLSLSVYRPRDAARAPCLTLLSCHIDCPPASSANLGLHPPAHGTRRRASLGGTMWQPQPQMLRCT